MDKAKSRKKTASKHFFVSFSKYFISLPAAGGRGILELKVIQHIFIFNHLCLFVVLSNPLLLLNNNIDFPTGGQSNLDIHPHKITCITWPASRGSFMESHVGTMDVLLVGRVNGTLAVVEVFDKSTFNRVELEHCTRERGKLTGGDLPIIWVGVGETYL